MSSRLFSGSNFHIHAGHQVLCRYIAKTEFVLGTIQLLTDTLDLNTEAHVIEKSARVFAGLESLKALALAAEAGAIPDGRGFVLPAPKPLMAANLLFPKLYPEMIEILQALGFERGDYDPSGRRVSIRYRSFTECISERERYGFSRTQRSVPPDLGAWVWFIRGQTDPIRTILFWQCPYGIQSVVLRLQQRSDESSGSFVIFYSTPANKRTNELFFRPDGHKPSSVQRLVCLHPYPAMQAGLRNRYGIPPAPSLHLSNPSNS